MAEQEQSEEPLVSITVCVRDGEQWIDECISSLVAQDWPNIEIIAVDDGSSDASTERLMAWDDPEGMHNNHPVRVITQGPKGLSAARSSALGKAKGEWVAITDIDVRPEPSWISQLMSARFPLDEVETVVAVTGRTVFESGESIISKLRASEVAEKYRNRQRTTSLANGPCSVFERRALLEIGGFDERWYHAEDMEVSLRLIGGGGTIVYSPDAVVNHIAEENITTFLAKRTRDARAHVRIVRHHPKRGRTVGFDFIGSAWWILMLCPVILLAISGLVISIETLYIESKPFDLSSNVQMLALICIIPLMIHLLYFPQTVIGSLLMLRRPIWSLRLIVVLYMWSWSLWKGLSLGFLDALLGRNGH